VTVRMKVFLSHSSSDKDLARQLALDLRSANIDVWLDQWELGVGEQIVQSIEHGVDEAEFVIVLLTRASVASEWVNREWRRKVHDEAQTERIAVVPVRGEPCVIPDFLAQRSHADISGGSYPLGFKHLLEILRHYSGKAGIEVPESTMVQEESSLTLLPVVTPIALEVGRDLIPIFEQDNAGASRFMNELAPGMRDALHAEFGFPFPGIRVLGNETDMPPRSALIMIDEVPEIMMEVGRDDVLVDGTVEELARFGIRGEPRDDPAAGRARARIDAADRAAAEAAGLTAWDAAEYLILALQAVIRRMASFFLDIDVTWRLVEFFKRTAPELVAETIPKAVSWFELTEVLQRLVDEEIGIGDMGRILKALSRREPDQQGSILLTERVRHALNGQITAKFIRGRDSLTVLRIDPEIEALISSAIQRTPVGSYLALAPRSTQDILTAIRGQVNSLASSAAGAPILVTVAEVRPYIRKLVKIEFPSLHVLSPQDLEPDTQIHTVARIRLDRSPHHGTPAGRGLQA
jgi:type III secretory pathway component EscV